MNQDAIEGLKNAAALLKTGNSKAARQIIIQILREDANNTQAWYMLSFAVPRQDKQIQALQQLLQIDPNHEKAQKRLQKLGGDQIPQGADLLSQRLFGDPGGQRTEEQASPPSTPTKTEEAVAEKPETASEPEPIQSEPVQPEPTQTEPIQPGSLLPELIQPEEKKSSKKFLGIKRRTLILITVGIALIALIIFAFSTQEWLQLGSQANAGNPGIPTFTLASDADDSSGGESGTDGKQATPTFSVPTPTSPPPTPTPDLFFFNTSNLTPPDEDTQALMLEMQDQISTIMGLSKDYPIDSYSISQPELESFLWDFDNLTGMKQNQEQLQTLLISLGLAQSTDDFKTFYSNLWIDPNGTLFLPRENLIAINGFEISPYQRYSYAQAYVQSIRNVQFPFEESGIYPPCDLTLQSCEVNTAVAKGEAVAIAFEWANANLTEDDLTKVQEGTKKIFYLYPVPSASSLMEAIRLFPYEQGYTFASTIYQNEGIDGLNALYDTPPTTTEQILHPEKYLLGENAAEVESTNIANFVPSEFSEVFTGSLGEWKTYLLLAYGINANARLSAENAATAAAGWGGDHIQIYTNTNSEQIIVSHWSFDSETETEEFLTAIQTFAFGFVSGNNTEIGEYVCNQSNTMVTCIAEKEGNVIWFLAPNVEIIEGLINGYAYLAPEAE
jgi:hypothetical protein